MCCCNKPNVNGELGYSWDGKSSSIRPVDPPELGEGDVLLYDEPGRCGGIDSHSYHYRIVKNRGQICLIVRHGGGDERIKISLYKQQPEVFDRVSSNDRYWILSGLYHAHSEAKRQGYAMATEQWQKAAADKKIKTRKVRGSNSVKVWIED